MLKDITKDIIARFGTQILKWAVIALALICLVVWVKSCAPWTKSNRQQATIERQKETIGELVNHSNQQSTAAANDREGREEAKNTLVEHLDTQAKDEKKFDDLITKVNKELIPPPKKPVKKPVAKPKPQADGQAPAADPEESTAQELADEAVRTQHNARLMQEAVWKAYEEAIAMSSRSTSPV